MVYDEVQGEYSVRYMIGHKLEDSVETENGIAVTPMFMSGQNMKPTRIDKTEPEYKSTDYIIDLLNTNKIKQG